MRLRSSVLLLPGAAALRASAAWAQEASEPVPSPTSFMNVILVIGVIAVVGFGVFLYSRARRPADPRSGVRPRVDESPRIDPADVAPRPSRPSERTIFISYRRADSADITGRIYDRLTERFGKEHVYKDVDSVPLGIDFRKHIGDLVQRCDAVIAIIGNQWASSQAGGARRLEDSRDLVRIEIAAALARGIPVVPVLVGGAVMPTEQDLPAEMQGLAYRNGISVRPDPDFHKDLDRLIAGIDAHFGKR